MRRWKAKITSISAICLLTTLQAFAATQGDTSSTGTVFRGQASTGIWVELAYDGAGQYELAILDGLPGQSPQTRFISMATETGRGGCGLKGTNGDAMIDRCPDSAGFAANISVGQASGRINFIPVGWRGSFAWGQASQTLGAIRTNCLLPRAMVAPGVADTPLAAAMAGVSTDATQLRPHPADLPAVLSRLRTERLRAYEVIALTPFEAEEARRIEDAVAGRPVLGRRVSLAEATRDRLAFDERVANNPRRTQAREELRQIDRALAEIYDPATATTQQAILARLEDQRLPALIDALSTTLSVGSPSAIRHLLAWEAPMSELDACVMAVAAVDSGAVIAVRESLAQRADEIVTAIGLSVSTASTADDKRAALTGWESNSAAMTALRQAGKSGALAPFRSQIIQTAQIENQARLQAQREAERQASLDRIAPTTSPSARLQAERISRSVVIVFNMTDNSSGSGFIVAPEVVVTNLHVVQPEGGNLFIVNDGKTLQSRLSAQILFRSATHDIAILKVPGLRGQVVELAGPEPSRGGDVWAYGFPGVADRSRRADSETEWIATLTRGIVSRVYSDYTLQSGRRGPQSRILQHDANIFPGNSGGPLFDSCHRVIGVNTQLSSERSFTVFYSVSATVLPDLLRQANVTPRISNSRC